MKTRIHPVITALFIFCSLVTAAQPPILNSMPSVAAAVYLDFDGHLVEGTEWNPNATITCGSSGLNNAQVTEIFNRIAEDYRPFAVNVTTDSTRFIAAPIDQRMRLVFTVSHEWIGLTGGVAFVGSFTWGTDCPCFVFTAALSYNTRNISEAGSHEIGHTLGLEHQSVYDTACVKIAEYNVGFGVGEIGWAPIMGIGYYQNFTLWNNGPNTTGCQNFQNELELITSINGIPFRNDDHPVAFGSASPVSFMNGQFNVSGIVERNTDQDMFAFTMPSAAQFRLDAIPYNVGSNNAGSDLDMQITLYKSDHSFLNVYNPGTLLNSVIDTFLNVGTYYLKVEGQGNIYAPNYASLGSYSLRGNIIQIALPLHRLELRGAITGEQHSLNWIIDADEEVVRQVLEYSVDGINFRQLAVPVNSSRQFIYRPTLSGPVQYRLFVSFSNGKDYYSNVITLRNTGESRPRLIGNNVSTSVMISSPALYDYSVVDLNGVLMVKGKVEKGTQTVSLPYMASGIYMVRFNGREGDVWVEKMVRK